MRTTLFLSALSALPLLSSSIPITLPKRTPPSIPSASTARTELAGLTVAAQGSQTGYSRDLFPHWSSQSSYGSGCDTREVVLNRDGSNVVQSSACAATSGTWYSPYDGATWTAASDVDIDHMVPLSNAWKVRKFLVNWIICVCLLTAKPQSGAASWTTSRRGAFANDLNSPQLWAVTDNVNQSEGDQGPEEWQPPLSKSGFFGFCVFGIVGLCCV